MPPLSPRAQALRRLTQRLVRLGHPRLEMSLLVLLTGLGGFLTSALLLHLGWTVLWSRWATALIVAYLLFLGLLGVWLHYRRDLDHVDVSDFSGSGGGHDHAPPPPGTFGGHGGSSAGGGASARFEGPSAPGGTPDTGGDGLGQMAGAVFEADEVAIPLLLLLVVLVVLASLLAAAGWVILVAPELLAELLLDAFMAAGLYRHLRRGGAAHWLETAVQRTWLPALGLLLVLAGAGALAQHLAPQAHSLGEVLQALRPR